LTDRQIERKIDDIVDRLSLKNCRDTIIGGHMVKGLSGGERKRTSIGYELITDPNFLLCDEPTSGLDSTTSLKIIRMLKKEAVDRKTNIICTIHSPSSEIFSTLDRLLLL
jgi:ABC-type multidrug transport system ATPase subunit